MTAPAIQAQNLRKQYDGLQALDGLNLSISGSSFFGLLGPNGSGKTTTIRILSTLSRADQGEASIAGFDVRRNPVEVRSHIGVVFQDSSLDQNLSVAENLEFAGALYGLKRDVLRQRIDYLLELFGLVERRRSLVRTLSGGMKRALDIVRGVLHEPPVLFLDEPTIGLDIVNRRMIWRFLSRLRDQRGVTMFLTTHYLEEASACDHVAFLRQGRLIDEGVPADLVRQIGAFVLEVEERSEATDSARAVLREELGEPIEDGDRLLFRVPEGAHERLPVWQEKLESCAESLRLRRPDLNDVYVWKL